MKIVAEELIDIVVQTIYLKKSDTWLCGLYKGCTFIGLVWDFKTSNVTPLIKAADELFPKDINDLEKFEKEFGERVTYHKASDYRYFDLTDLKLKRLFED